jgi:hypothetical protein
VTNTNKLASKCEQPGRLADVFVVKTPQNVFPSFVAPNKRILMVVAELTPQVEPLKSKYNTRSFRKEELVSISNGVPSSAFPLSFTLTTSSPLALLLAS